MSTLAEVRLWGKTIGAVSLLDREEVARFEYDAAFAQIGIQVAPLVMPLSRRANSPGLKPELWGYVIVHELLHFSVPNHGKLWKSLMRVHLGEYEVHEGELMRIAGNQAPQHTGFD